MTAGLNRVEIAGDPGATALKVDGKVLAFDAATLAVDPRSVPVLTVSLPVVGGVVVTLDARIRLAPTLVRRWSRWAGHRPWSLASLLASRPPGSRWDRCS